MSTDSNTIMQLSDSGNAEGLRDVLRDKAIRSLYFFCKVVAGYSKLKDYLHLPYCDMVQSTAHTDPKRAFMWPRGYYKSSIAKGYALWSLIPCPEYDPFGNLYDALLRIIHDPDGPVLFVSESESVASSKLRDIRYNIESNQLMQWLFPELLPPTGAKWTDTEITLGGRTRSMDESSLTAIGVGGKITGFHFRKIIYDDIIGEKAAESEAEMEKAWSWFEVAPGLLQDPGTGEELIKGTRWKHGTADIYGRIKVQLKLDDLDVEGPESSRKMSFVFFERAIIENNEPTFPDKYPLPVIKALERRLGSYRFGCNYMNNPNLPEGADFKPAWIKEYRIGEDKRTIIPLDGTSPINISRLLRMSFWDISAGGQTAKAENAVVVAGEDSLRRVFALSSWSKNCSIGDAGEEWHRKNDRYRCYHNHYEWVGAQKVAEDLEKQRNLMVMGGRGRLCLTCGESHYQLDPIGVQPPGGKNKEDRIRMFAQEAFQQGRVYIYEGMLKLKGQILAFPHGDLVDEFDAFAYLINLLRAPLSDEELADEKEEEEKHQVLAGKSRTITGERNYGGYV